MKNFNNKGVTLVEIIVVISLALMIFVLTFNSSQNFFSWNSSTQDNLEAQFGARKVLKVMVKELRSASFSSLGAYPVSLASSTSLVFFSNIDDDSYKERIRYFLDGSTLKKGVIEPSGSPLEYNLEDEDILTLITGVNQGEDPVFEYFDNTYTGTSVSLVQPVSVTDVRLVRITVKIEEDPNKSLNPLIVETQVFLRNLKDNL